MELENLQNGAIVRTEGETTAALVYLAGLAPTGRRTMAGALRGVAMLLGGQDDLAAMDWGALRFEHVVAIRAKLAESLAPATVNKYLAALRGVALAAWGLGQMSADDLAKIKSVKGVRGHTLPAGRALGGGELRALLGACRDGTPAGTRDAAILALGYGCGLRRAELAALGIDSILADNGEFTIKILGKGSKERLAYADNGAAAALAQYLATRGDAPGPLFLAGRKGGKLGGAGMTPQAIRDVVSRRASQAGLASLSPHDLRRSFVSDLLDSGVDIATVASMAGHANVQTTARYDRRGETAKRRAAKSLFVPIGE